MKAISKLAIPLILLGVVAVGTKVEAKPKYFCPQYHSLLRKYNLPIKIFDPIMWRESRCQPQAIGWNYKYGKSERDCKLSPAKTYRKCKAVRSYDSGLLQINSSWKTVTAQVCGAKFGDLSVLLKPECNVRVAAVLFDNGNGLSNWKASSGRN